jgi:hypothetical protein
MQRQCLYRTKDFQQTEKLEQLQNSLMERQDQLHRLHRLLQ